jgi:hypothetical protein
VLTIILGTGLLAIATHFSRNPEQFVIDEHDWRKYREKENY